jgi:hypothetical protein
MINSVDSRSVCGVLRQFLDDSTKSIRWLESALLKEGLVVISSGQKQVLEAMENMDESELNYMIQSQMEIGEACLAELNRRKIES